MEFLHNELYPSAEDHPGDVCYVLVCRVAMGYSIRTQTRAWNTATGLWDKQCVAMDGAAASSNKLVFATDATRELVPLPGTEDGFPIHYHSLVAETGKTVQRFREFVVMHGDYVYPEFIVAYRRKIVPPPGVEKLLSEIDEPEPEPEPEQVPVVPKRSILGNLSRRSKTGGEQKPAGAGVGSLIPDDGTPLREPEPAPAPEPGR